MIGSIRPDLAQGLKTEFNKSLGMPGSDQRARMESIYENVMTDGELDLKKLASKTSKELAKLEDASEGFESFFVKKLLSQMRATINKGESQMMAFARDTMDDAVAQAAAQGQSSIGIAKTVFLAQGLRVVQSAPRAHDLTVKDN
jgi:Rod binding domain-containing protein